MLTRPPPTDSSLAALTDTSLLHNYKMIYSAVVLAAAAFTGLASAQNYSTSGPLTVDPNSVDYDLRLSWCRAQTNSCPMICGGQAYPNSCDAVRQSAVCFLRMPKLTDFTDLSQLHLHLHKRHEPKHLLVHSDPAILRVPAVD